MTPSHLADTSSSQKKKIILLSKYNQESNQKKNAGTEEKMKPDQIVDIHIEQNNSDEKIPHRMHAIELSPAKMSIEKIREKTNALIQASKGNEFVIQG